MHEYRRLIQSEMDARGWSVSELARRAGMHRQTVNKIIKDTRSHISQMPDDATIERISGAFGIPAERLSQAAARSLIGEPAADGDPLDSYSTAYLLDYIKRRVADPPTRTTTIPEEIRIAARTSDDPKG